MCPPRELHNQDVPGHDGRMQVDLSGGVLFSLPQRKLDFFHGIKIQELVARSRFEPVLALLAIRRAEQLN